MWVTFTLTNVTFEHDIFTFTPVGLSGTFYHTAFKYVTKYCLRLTVEAAGHKTLS